jgi:hypothetical protein
MTAPGWHGLAIVGRVKDRYLDAKPIQLAIKGR